MQAVFTPVLLSQGPRLGRDVVRVKRTQYAFHRLRTEPITRATLLLQRCIDKTPSHYFIRIYLTGGKMRSHGEHGTDRAGLSSLARMLDGGIDIDYTPLHPEYSQIASCCSEFANWS